jgi:hypothetical protein
MLGLFQFQCRKNHYFPTTWVVSLEIVYFKTHARSTRLNKIKKIAIRHISDTDNRPSMKISVYNNEFNALLGSGSLVTVLDRNAKSLLKNWNLTVQPYTNVVTNAKCKALHVLGVVHLPITLNGVTKVLNVVVLPSLNREMLLGMDFFESWILTSPKRTVPLQSHAFWFT